MFLIGTLVLMVAGGIFWSCQKDEFVTNPENGLMLKSDYIGADCHFDCIDPSNPEYFEMTDNMSITAGTNTVKYTYVAYNTLDEFVIDIKYEKTAGTTNGKATITVSFEDKTPIIFTDVVLGTTKTAIFDLPTGWKACDEVEFSIVGEGVGDPASFTNVLYSLFGECTDCDDASFLYKTENNNLDILFSYNHNEEMNLTIEFTFPQVLNSTLVDGKYVGADDKLYDVNNPDNQTVFTWTGVVGCKANDPTTFAFNVAPDCDAPPANDGQAIIWTDAKIVAIDGVALEVPFSLKGGNSNIVYTGCPIN